MAELANASIVRPRDPGSNLGGDKILSDSVCVGFEFKFVGLTLTLEHHLLI